METLIDALKGQPWWIYVLFAYLVYVGIKAKKPQLISINKLFIIPLVFVAWSIYGLIVGFEGLSDILFWLVAGVAGFFVGGSLTGPIKKLRADRKKLLVYLPGSSTFLVLILVVFAVKYFFGYYEATNQAQGAPIHVASLIVSGAITGIFVGRVRPILLKFSKTKHENLKKGGNPRKKSLL